MSITVEATYEDGMHKVRQPLPLQERQVVRITVEPAESRARRTAGLMGWTGGVELAERFALDADLGAPSVSDVP